MEGSKVPRFQGSKVPRFLKDLKVVRLFSWSIKCLLETENRN